MIKPMWNSRFSVITQMAKHSKGEAEVLRMPGSAFRKVGLGKDVTDKFYLACRAFKKKAVMA